MRGIYLITNIRNAKVYIGSSSNAECRIWQHISLLKSNKHHNPHLQAACNKYGIENFAWTVAEEVPSDIALADREQEWIDVTKAYDNRFGYNIRPDAFNRKQSEETKRKLSVSRMGELNPMYGHKMSDEQKELRRKLSTGRRHKPESIAKMKSNLLGHAVSQATRDKISASKKGKASWNKGKKMSDAMREKCRQRMLRQHREKRGNE